MCHYILKTLLVILHSLSRGKSIIVGEQKKHLRSLPFQPFWFQLVYFLLQSSGAGKNQWLGCSITGAHFLEPSNANPPLQGARVLPPLPLPPLEQCSLCSTPTHSKVVKPVHQSVSGHARPPELRQASPQPRRSQTAPAAPPTSLSCLQPPPHTYICG